MQSGRILGDAPGHFFYDLYNCKADPPPFLNVSSVTTAARTEAVSEHGKNEIMWGRVSHMKREDGWGAHECASLFSQTRLSFSVLLCTHLHSSLDRQSISFSPSALQSCPSTT